MNEKRPRASIGLNSDSVRRRLASTPPDKRRDIGRVWSEQKRLEQEQWKLAPDDKPLFQELKLLFQKNMAGLKSVYMKVNAKKSANSTPKMLRSYAKAHPMKIGAILALVLVLVPFVLAMTQRGQSNPPKSLGANTAELATLPDDGKTDEKPVFTQLHPGGKTDLLEVTRKTPTGELVHTFRDTIEGIDVEVTQQELPETFKSSLAVELEKMAKNFQATDVIQVDDSLIFHGLDEETRVQSLFTAKKGVLISIRSAAKLSDDTWAAYFLALQ